jgi:predicted nuclease of predicted toxin-antitoxin system
MRLLLDNNLSPRLVQQLSDLFPEVAHVESAGLAEASDEEVWAHARDKAYLIVTKDSDFAEIQVLRGYPPKVVWIRLGNCTTTQLEGLLRHHSKALADFEADPASGMLLLR